jgi:hypothetical protein
MRQAIIETRRFMRQPLTVVLGVVAGAGAAKSGHGAGAAAAILSFYPIYFVALASFLAARGCAALLTRLSRDEDAA